MRTPLPKRTLLAAARRFGTPLYVYDAAGIRARLGAFQRAFASIPHLVCYALKANSNAGVGRVLAREGAGAEVVSGGELWRALRSGFPPRRVVFSGTGKTEEEIAYALRSGILLFNAESEEELSLLQTVGRRLRKTVPLSIRVNPGIDAGTHAHLATGKAESKFGVAPHVATALYQKAARSGAFEVLGIHAHLGSQIGQTAPYRKALGLLLRMAHDLRAGGTRLVYLDIGGGWAVPEEGGGLPVRDLAKSLLPELKGKPYTLILEPGRSLVAAAGALVAKVLYRKIAGAKRFIIVDAAMNDFIRPTLYGARHPVVNLSRRGGVVHADVVGPVCESGDFLARECALSWPERGDLLAVLNAGAYGFSMASQYNSRPRAAEVLVDGTLKLVRRREGYSDLVQGER